MIVCTVCTDVESARAEAVTKTATAAVTIKPTMMAEILKSLLFLNKLKLLGAYTGTGTKQSMQVSKEKGYIDTSQHKV